MATVDQLRRRDAGLPTSDFREFSWRPTVFGDWSTVAYQQRPVPRQRTSRRPRRQLNGPVTVRYVAPRV